MPTAASIQHWLVKTEPDSFSIDDLAAAPRKTTCWDGVRNYQARNYLKAMHRGDQVLFYHSGAKPPAIVGLTKVVRQAYPDPTAWDPQDHHFDPGSTAADPRWFMVDLQLVRAFDAPLGLDALRKIPALKNMELLRKGSRLSVQPVSASELAAILKLANAA